MFLNCSLFCSTILLHDVQMNRTYNDSKYFVDQPSKATANQILLKYQQKDDWKSLLSPPGSDLNSPIDIKTIDTKDFNGFMQHIDTKWESLTLESKEKWTVQTSITLPYPFIIPGGRFREMYYWDNYFIIKGLLDSSTRHSKYLHRAYGIIQNLLYLIKTYGFVPNGSRKYYLNRSQPPLLTWMVWDYFEATNNKTFLMEAIPLLNKEYNYFHVNRMKSIQINGTNYKVFHYSSDSVLPRPESYYEDISLLKHPQFGQKNILFKHITAAAESGWDFSSRWYLKKFENMNTADIIPVDLNFIMLKNYKIYIDMLKIANTYSESHKINFYSNLYEKRLKDYQRLFFHKDMWYDILPNNKHHLEYYASNLTPLWTISNIHDFVNTTAILLEISKIKNKSGLPVSLQNTGQQWDYPNVWPPMQYLIIQGIQKYDFNMAKDMALNFIGNVFCIWNKTDVIYEKYNCCEQEAGEGGEYDVQIGFGWTNGVILELTRVFGPSETCPVYDQMEISSQKEEETKKVAIGPRILLILGEAIVLASMLYFLHKPDPNRDISMSRL